MKYRQNFKNRHNLSMHQRFVKNSKLANRASVLPGVLVVCCLDLAWRLA